MTGPEHLIEFAHGYTYSAHPLACAAGLATLATYEEEGLLTRAAELQGYFGECGARAEERAQRHRHPQHRAGGRHRAEPARRASRASAPSTSSPTASSRAC
jgi:adenosylmethionine-8-amino-7-oxononanoate aminotransferase